MKKKERQKLIKELIQLYDIHRQEELMALLHKQKCMVTQATVSRDINEMRLVKTPVEDGHSKYCLPTERNPDKIRLVRMIRHHLLAIEQLNYFIHLKTTPGSGVALGNLVEMVYQEQLFTVMTNDDKVLLITRTEAAAIYLLAELSKLQTFGGEAHDSGTIN